MAKFTYPKKPKAPKATASTSAHEKYAQRVDEWTEKCIAVNKAKEDHKAAQAKTNQLKGVTLAGVLAPKTKSKTKTKKRR